MRLLVLDGNSILNRAFYGIKLLTTKDGHYTNALVGFLNIFQKLRDQTAPDRIAVAFDRKAPTFRHQRYEAYKAGRKGMPEELAEQLPVIKELLGLMAAPSWSGTAMRPTTFWAPSPPPLCGRAGTASSRPGTGTALQLRWTIR